MLWLAGMLPAGQAAIASAAGVARALASSGATRTSASFVAAPPPHVMVVVEENQESTSIIGNSNAPYINSLATKYASATQWYSVEHTSQLDYMDLLTGANQNCCAGAPYSATTLVDELHAKSTPIPWKAYMENMPSNCTKLADTTGLYQNTHNPFRYFTKYTTNSGGWCSTTNQNTEGVLTYPAGGVVSALTGTNAPDFVWITPNDCNDMHGDTTTGSTCTSSTSSQLITAGDTWLSTNIAPVISSTWFKQNGVIIITWDEGTSGKGCCGLTSPGGHIATIVVTSNNQGLGQFTGIGDHFGTLAAIEKAYGVALLGGSASSVNGDLTGAFGQSPSNFLSPEDASFESGTVGTWAPWSNSTLANSTAHALDGTHSLAMTSAAAGYAYAYSLGPSYYTISPSTSYSFLASMFSGTAARTGYLQLEWYDATKTVISESRSGGSSLSTSAWTSLSYTTTSPSNAAFVLPIVIAGSAAGAGEITYIDALSLAPAAATTNLLSPEDASFEGGTVGTWAPWSNSTLANSTAHALDGTHSLAMTSAAAGYAYAYSLGPSYYTISPSTSYSFLASMFSGTAARTGYLQLEWYDATKTVISESRSGGSSLSTSAWTSLSYTTTSPSNAAFVLPIVIAGSAAGAGEITYIDALSLAPAAATTNLLSPEDASFEGGTVGTWAPWSNSTLANSTAHALDGTHSLAMTSAAAGYAYAYSLGPSYYTISPSTSYSFLASMFSGTAARTGYLQLEWYDATKTVISESRSGGSSLSTSAWTSLSYTTTSPSNAAFVLPIVIAGSAAGAGEVTYIDETSLAPGTSTVWTP